MGQGGGDDEDNSPGYSTTTVENEEALEQNSDQVVEDLSEDEGDSG